MALGSRLLDVCVTMACVLGTARCSDGGGWEKVTSLVSKEVNVQLSPSAPQKDQSECPCSGIPPWPLTEPPPEDCHQLNRTFRYTCLKGYLRTAGTSNLIKCKPGSSRWSNPTLICKLDPRGVAPHAPNSTDAVEHTMELESDSPKIGVPSLQQHDETRLETENPAKGPGTPTIAVVSSVLVAIVALIGIGLILHKMRRRAETVNPTQTAAEGIPLNEATS
ncbi:interleukin-15 receptor subunit alpha isoform X3 [Phycodurus eques]|uniref:interleukin-15 receptor subunit alpha isoform X3 n=1 Tax=Phycodurus eques TaxID=693459 RepID=UPI002ACD2326|nr:interleukin-15 receptor subunit alpha isoform X3 [Phycodurus eques]